jgi:hypothetical protein
MPESSSEKVRRFIGIAAGRVEESEGMGKSVGDGDVTGGMFAIVAGGKKWEWTAIDREENRF